MLSLPKEREHKVVAEIDKQGGGVSRGSGTKSPSPSPLPKAYHCPHLFPLSF